LGVEIILIPMRRLMGGASDWRAFKMLRQTIRDGDYDILHTHMSKAALLGALIGMTDRGIKVVNTGHNFGFVALPQRWKKAIFWCYDRFISSFGHDATVTVSQIVADAVVKARMVPRKRLHAIPNGIRVRRFDAIASAPLELKTEVLGTAMTDGPLITCVARLVWFKGLHTLIDALPDIIARHPDSRVLIVGDGELRADLETQAKRLGVDHTIVFAGERDDIPQLLKISDLFVLPSLSEGLPISLLEAMATGLPLVATRVGGIPELIEEGKNGYLVPSSDTHALGQAILSFLDDPEKMHQAGLAGRELLEKQFSQTAMVQKTEELYLDLIHAAKGG
jgi:glycosyltransferase involved in cell wall biosynthesis